ncbi:hypothetical protein BOTCAL_0138g00010 [Botryotinia calthae]|uniref:Heterokaryon incompatibility domain-containing protein n=1 Tax=Botryotinia calthae TaxID=38488 RepID=A0A4Y8D383_9HELO|nr:hypothetical protein BOTCAL_0138g00010 [Botryotinia calthae]
MIENTEAFISFRLAWVIDNITGYYTRIAEEIFNGSGSIYSPSIDAILARPAFLSIVWQKVIVAQEAFKHAVDQFEMQAAEVKKLNPIWGAAHVEDISNLTRNDLFELYGSLFEMLCQIRVIENIEMSDLPPPLSSPITDGNVSPAPFKYIDLTSPKDEIRLVRFELGSAESNSGVCMTTRTVNFRDGIRYATLSYTWSQPYGVFSSEADSKSEARIDIPIMCDGQILKVENTRVWTPVISGTPPQEFWIDAICINQENNEEKEAQVSVMGDIYTYSLKTWIWLEDKDAFSHTALNIMQIISEKVGKRDTDAINEITRIEEEEIVKEMDLPDRTSWKWFALFAFLQRQWFRRSWVIQEAVLSSEIEILCGSTVFNWSLLAGVCSFLSQSGLLMRIQGIGTIEMQANTIELTEIPCRMGRKVHARQSDELRSNPVFYFRPDLDITTLLFVENITILKSFDTSIKSKDTFFFHTLGDGIDPIAMLLDLWKISRRNPCFDARDKVFACASLANKDVFRTMNTVSTRRQLLPDYQKAVSEVYQEAAWFTLLTHASLHILSITGHTTLHNTHDVPSWVPDLSQSPNYHGFWEIMMRKSGFEWLAAGNSCWEIPPQEKLYKRYLMVQVVFVDKICDIQHQNSHFGMEDRSRPRPHYTEMVDFFQEIAVKYTNKGDIQGLFEVLWRTTIADFACGASPAAQNYALEFEKAYWKEVLMKRDDYLVGNINEVLWKRIKEVMVSIKRLGWLCDDWVFIFDAVQNETDETEEFKALMYSVMGNLPDQSKEFKSRVESTMGYRRLFFTDLGYAGSGDLNISIGDEVVIMAGSPVPFILRQGIDGRYKLIGEAYVHGIMFGEKAADDHHPWVAERHSVIMATVTSTATELPSWKLRLRSVAADYRSTDPDDLPNFIRGRFKSSGVDLKDIQSSIGSFEDLKKAHTEKFKQQLADFRGTASDSKIFEPIGSKLITGHQDYSGELQQMTDKLKEEGASKQTSKERMQKGRKDAKERSNGIVDETFDDAEAKIDSLPEEQKEGATDIWLIIVDGFFVFWAEVMEWIKGIIDVFVEWLAGVWDTVKKIWNTVTDVFGHTWDWYTALL